MWLRVLGSAAGGGFPQWNCGCPGCRAVRDRLPARSPRTQSSIAVSADQRQWFLFNASPDIRSPDRGLPRAAPARRAGRRRCRRCCSPTPSSTTRSACCCCGRRAALEVHATPAGARDAARRLRACWRRSSATARSSGDRSSPAPTCPSAEGLVVPGVRRAHHQAGAVRHRRREPGRVVGYRFTDERSGGPLVYLPGVQRLTPEVRAELADCACLLIDGTCWRDDELIRLGLAGKTVPRDGPPAHRRPGRQPGAAPVAAASSARSTSTSTTPTRSCWRTRPERRRRRRQRHGGGHGRPRGGGVER